MDPYTLCIIKEKTKKKIWLDNAGSIDSVICSLNYFNEIAADF